MLSIIFLAFLAPLAIFLGLFVLKSALLTFILFYGFVCLLVPLVDLVIIQKKGGKDFLTFLGFKKFGKSFFPALIAGLIFGALIVAFFILLQDYVIDFAAAQAALAEWKINNRYLILLLFTMIIANSIFEEIYWRGYIFAKLSHKVKPLGVVFITSLFYASYHLITTARLFSFSYAILLTFAVFLAGLFWGFTRNKFDSIFFPIISHLLADLGIMAVYIKFFGGL